MIIFIYGTNNSIAYVCDILEHRDLDMRDYNKHRYDYQIKTFNIRVSPLSHNISQYLPCLHQEEQIQFVDDLLNKSGYSNAMVNMLQHPKISPQLLI